MNFRRTTLLVAATLMTGQLGLVKIGEISAQSPQLAPRSIPTDPRVLLAPPAPLVVPDSSSVTSYLSDGTPVVVIEDRGLPLVQIVVAVAAGADREPEGHEGLARLTAAMLRRGGAGVWGADDFDRRVDFLGIDLDSVAGATRAGLQVQVPTWGLDGGIDALGAVFRRPRLEESRFETLRRNMLSAMSTRVDEPLEVLEREWLNLLYGADHTLSREPTSASLARLTIDQLRTFHREVWLTARSVVAVSGDVSASDVVPKLEAALIAPNAPASGEMASESDSGSKVPEALNDRPSSGQDFQAGSRDRSQRRGRGETTALAEPGLYHVEFDSTQTKVLLGHRTRSTSWTDRDALQIGVLDEVLGGRILGRVRVRDRLVYQAAASVRLGQGGQSRQRSGNLSLAVPNQMRISFETVGRAVPTVLQAIREEIEFLRRRPLSEADLDVARRAVLASLGGRFETADSTAGYLAEDHLLARPRDYWSTVREAVESVDPTRLRDLARRTLMVDELVIVTVGRWSEIASGAESRQALERIAGGPIRHLPVRDPLTLRPLDSSH